MNTRYFFYKNNKVKKIDLNSDFESFYFTPTLFKNKLHKGLYKRSNWLYLFWYFITFGSYRILYIKHRDSLEIAHFSNIIPKFFKYDFMGQSDLQIANCFTYNKYRGRQLYSFALSEINKKFKDRIIWIGSHGSNFSSIKVIERLGFEKMFDVEKRTVLGIYYKINE